ncbi:MAG TPA: iron-sulfur cluster-binding domain-containing protein [Planctomycetaceae bacterium]|nr:iron-sulfur cluster-binding domain-containing protein [Planctomycetaceae bacterium]HIQ21500.1 iron-sulfur cluster-binding domain-containing protein [Planctomycetota bacterium]
MMEAVKTMLAELGVPAEQIHTEDFGSQRKPQARAAERVGVEIDYSCRVGMCGVCAVKLLSGQVTMETDDGLDPDDRAAGKVLACQAKASEGVAVEA